MGGVLVPTFIGGGATGWQLVDFLRLRLTTPAAASGTAQVATDPNDPDELWLIDRAVIGCTSGTTSSLRLYESSADPSRYLDGSDKGNFDVAEYPQGLAVWPLTSLVAVWSGCSAGAVGSLGLQGRVLRRKT